MSDTQLKVTMINHVGVDIAASPDAVWQAILEEYIEMKKFREVARIESIDDPAAALGGYHMLVEKDGVVVDERIIHITERDEAARRLSLYADYLKIPGGMQVYATYHAQTAPGGARFQIDCHSRVPIEAPVGGARADVAAALAGTAVEADKHLAAYLDSVKARLEAAN